MKKKKIWGLGGYSHAAPPDTLPAYWGALGAGADGLALSVGVTQDGAIVCAPPTVVDGDGNKQLVAELTLDELTKIDTATTFRSGQLSDSNQVIDTGDDTPWIGRGGHHGFLRYVSLERVLLLFSQRTQLMLIIESSGTTVASTVAALLTKFGVLDRVIIAGDQAVLSYFSSSPLCLIHGEQESIGDTLFRAKDLDATVIASVSALLEAPDSEVRCLVRPEPGFVAVSATEFDSLSQREGIDGWLATAPDRMHRLVYPRGLIIEENFEGPGVDKELWATGYSRKNDDTRLTFANGINIKMEGDSYSGGAALSEFSVHGDFDARLSFAVSNPSQGTTFELAVVQIDAGYHRPNLTFDVHGAPPYASAERDEADGFRIGWNNGPALTRWVGGDPQSSNLYNNYSRDVGYAGADSPSGELRLTRNGEVFSAFFRDQANRGWVLSGTALVPALAQSVFFRLAAKHWPKQGNSAPTNEVRLWGFQLHQW